jgi:uncharacterized membrane protein
LWGEQSPWYVRILTGISAWIAAILFLVFVFSIDLLDSEASALLLGVILLVLTTITRWKVDQVFVNQLMLALNLAGQAMFLFGLTDNEELAAMAIVGLEIVLILVCRDAVLRFLATLFAYAAVVSLGDMYDIPNALHALIILTAGAVGVLWYHEAQFLTRKSAPIYKSVRYGITLTLLLLLIPSMLEDVSVTSWWASTCGLLFVLLLVEHRLLNRYAIPLSSATGIVMMMCTVLFAVPLLTTPGIIAAVLVLVLGFHRGQRVLMGLALVFLVIFMIAFYYHLDVTLLMKSGILATSGIVLLGMRWALLRQFALPTHDTHAHT